MNWKLFIDDDGFTILDLMRGHEPVMSTETTDCTNYPYRLEAALRMANELGIVIQDERTKK